MSVPPLRVLVLYSHPLLGEGMSCMLAGEPGLAVTAADASSERARDAALATAPDVVVLEEGGPLDAAEVLRRSGCRIVVDVDIRSGEAFTLERATIRSRPDEILSAIRHALGRPVVGVGSPATGTPRRSALPS